MNLTLDQFKNIILLNIYRTDFLSPKLRSKTKNAIIDHLFSRTILVGKDTCRVSHSELAKLTGISTPTISKAMRGLIKDGIVLIRGAYKPRVSCEYGLNINVPKNIELWFSPQRNPWLLLGEIIGEDDAGEENIELTAEGQAVINSIKDNLSHREKEELNKKAREELIFLEKDLTEANIERKIAEILVRNFSEEKKKIFLKRSLKYERDKIQS
jgi:DNA-binding Lrp family transcriptional regulator